MRMSFVNASPDFLILEESSITAHPLRDDPYALYAGYATAPIGGGDWVELAPDAGPDRLSRLRTHDMNSFATEVLAGDGDAEAVLRHLETRGRCTVCDSLSFFQLNPRTGLDSPST